jgi:hypothetical protein
MKHNELFKHDEYVCSCGFTTTNEIQFEIHSKNYNMKRDTITPEWINSILNKTEEEREIVQE